MTKRDEINQLKAAWQKCLRAHGIEKNIGPRDEIQLARANQLYGLSDALLAILGAEIEKGNDKFDPSQYLSLMRVFNPSKVDRFILIGAKEQTRIKKSQALRDNVKRSLELVQQEVETHDRQCGVEVDENGYVKPEEVRKVINRIFRPAP